VGISILSNKEAHGRKGCLVAIVKGTKAKEVTSILKKIPEVVRLQVEEVRLDFSDSMPQIVSACFPKAMITLARFHHQQFCLEALQEIRIGHRREVMTEVANARDDFRAMIKDLIKSRKPLVDADDKPIRSNAAYHVRQGGRKTQLFCEQVNQCISRIAQCKNQGLQGSAKRCY